MFPLRVVRAERIGRSVVFLLHIALEAPIAIMGLLSPLSLPFIQLTNTTLVLLKVRTPRTDAVRQLVKRHWGVPDVFSTGSGPVYRGITRLCASRYAVCYALFRSILTSAPTEFLPGKRALGMALCFYHVTCSTILFNAPRFIPHTFGAFAESYVFRDCAPSPSPLQSPISQPSRDARGRVGDIPRYRWPHTCDMVAGDHRNHSCGPS